MNQPLDDHSLEVQQNKAFIKSVYIALVSFTLGLVTAALMHEDGHAVANDSYHPQTNFAPVPKPDAVPTGCVSLAPGHLFQFSPPSSVGREAGVCGQEGKGASLSPTVTGANFAPAHKMKWPTSTATAVPHQNPAIAGATHT